MFEVAALGARAHVECLVVVITVGHGMFDLLGGMTTDVETSSAFDIKRCALDVDLDNTSTMCLE